MKKTSKKKVAVKKKPTARRAPAPRKKTPKKPAAKKRQKRRAKPDLLKEIHTGMTVLLGAVESIGITLLDMKRAQAPAKKSLTPDDVVTSHSEPPPGKHVVVRHNKGWCAAAIQEFKLEEVATQARVETKCENVVVQPLGVARGTPTCARCLREL